MNHLQAAGKAHILSKMIVAENKLQWRLSGRVRSRDGDCFLVEMSKYVRKYANGVSKESCEYSSHNASEKLYRTGTAPGLPPSPLGGGHWPRHPVPVASPTTGRVRATQPWGIPRPDA